MFVTLCAAVHRSSKAGQVSQNVQLQLAQSKSGTACGIDETLAVLIGQTCGSMQRVEQESLELGTCCSCTEGMCTSTAAVVTVSTMLRPCLLHAAQIMSSGSSSLQSASAVVDVTYFPNANSQLAAVLSSW